MNNNEPGCIKCSKYLNLRGPFLGYLISNVLIQGEFTNNVRAKYSTEQILFYVCDNCLKKRAIMRMIGGIIFLIMSLFMLIGVVFCVYKYNFSEKILTLILLFCLLATSIPSYIYTKSIFGYKKGKEMIKLAYLIAHDKFILRRANELDNKRDQNTTAYLYMRRTELRK
jgi:predicted membrane protein